MKQFSKQLSWLLAFVLIFTSIVSTGSSVFASDTITIGSNTDQNIVTGTHVESDDFWGNINITYYESANSDTVLFTKDYADTIGPDDVGMKPYAWHVTFVEKNLDISSTTTSTTYYFKAYPVTSLEETPVGAEMTLPAGTILTTTGSAINVSVYVGDTKLTDYQAISTFTLPTASSLTSSVSEDQFNSTLDTEGYKLPNLSKLFYTAEIIDKSTDPYSLKVTLVPTVDVTFNENTGTPDLDGIKMYATINTAIDITKLPTVSKDGLDFYGWKRPDNKYVSILNPTNSSNIDSRVSNTIELKAIYKEKTPTFKLDLLNKKVTNLLPNRTYAYPKFDWGTFGDTTIIADANGEFSYENLDYFTAYAQLSLNPEDNNISTVSNYASLNHGTPNTPIVENSETTASVTNNTDFDDCEFAIRATSDESGLKWGTSSTFTGLTPQTEYKVYVKHIADKNGFESNQAESVAFTILPAKVVSNDTPNGVTIDDVAAQAHTSSAIEPILVIKDGNKTLVEGTDYSVAYANNTNVGTATATVTFMNEYKGTMTKNFEIKNLYLVSFDANGGIGTMSNVSVMDGQKYTLPACSFTAPAKKQFKAWNVGGTEYAVGANITITADTTITAVWKDLDKAKTPVISPNGGTFSSSQTVTIESETANAIIYYTTDGTEPTTTSIVYSKPFTINSSVTVKAIAVKSGMFNSDIASANFTKSSSNNGGNSSYTPTFTVKFNTNGGNTIDSKSIKLGSTVGALPTPTKDGYEFAGWYSNEDFTMAYDVNTKITASTTLFAKWTKKESNIKDDSKNDANNENKNDSNNATKNELTLTIGKKTTNVFGVDKTIDSAPTIKNNRTMLPARFIAESLGAKVTWNGKKREVTITGKNKSGENVTIILYIDSDIAYVNGKKVKLDSPAFIENGRTFTPLRFVAEQLGANVLWISKDKKIVITK